MKKQLTQTQIAARDERRQKFRAIVAQIAKMPEADRVALVGGGFTTVEGHPLSFKNQMLIALQLPHASVLGGFRQWIAAGRSVMKGQHGAMIWIPCGKKQDDGSVEAEEGESGPRFLTATVFDISQTQAIEAGTAVVGAEIADAFGMRGLPNTIVDEEPAEPEAVYLTA